jgi:hypothetical protein
VLQVHRQIHIRKLGHTRRIADRLMARIMKFGTFPDEGPQLSHPWNWQQLSRRDIDYLDSAGMVQVEGFPGEKTKRQLGVRLHMPRFGGWRNYVTLTADVRCLWYVGWVSTHGIGVSRVPVHESVRMLVGCDRCAFFAIRQNGRQLPLRMIGKGRIGDHGPHRAITLR